MVLVGRDQEGAKEMRVTDRLGPGLMKPTVQQRRKCVVRAFYDTAGLVQKFGGSMWRLAARFDKQAEKRNDRQRRTRKVPSRN